jgi:arylsulfatase A
MFGKKNLTNNSLIGLAGLASGLFISGCHSQDPDDLPNIVLILADDMGYECLGCNGSIEYKTPNIDRLAATGIRFENCYSQPLSTPSRVKLMTGKYNFRNYEDFGYLNPDEKTFGNLLKGAGYETCIAGKWQLNGLNRNNPGNQDVTRPNQFGFDEYCLWQLHHTRAQGERYANPLLTRNGEDLPMDRDAYGPQSVVNYLTDFIERKADKPFFIYHPMMLPHDPFVPTPDSPEWAEPSRRYENDTAYFADMIAYIDKIVGQIQMKLKEKDLWDNTLLILTADNGTNTSVITNTLKGKVRGGKGSSINTGNHVPMIISWPEKIKKGRVFNGIVDFTDILPTLADAASLDPSSCFTDGKSFIDVLSGRNKRRDKDEIFIHYSPRWGGFKHNRWVMDGEYKLYQDGIFYNTLNDPGEKTPLLKLSDKEMKIRKKFQDILTEKETGFPFSWNDSKFSPPDK